MAALSNAELTTLVQRYFGDLGPQAVQTMLQIIQAESGGNPSATGDNYSSGHQSKDSAARYDYGLAQINSQHGYDANRLTTDPAYNLQAAREIYDRQGFQAWSTYNQGLAGTKTMPNNVMSDATQLYYKFYGQNAQQGDPALNAIVSALEGGQTPDQVLAALANGDPSQAQQRKAWLPPSAGGTYGGSSSAPIDSGSLNASLKAAGYLESEPGVWVRPGDGLITQTDVIDLRTETAQNKNNYNFQIGANGEVYRFDPNTGQVQPVGTYPGLADPNQQPNLNIQQDPATGRLVGIDPVTGARTDLGSFGFPGVDPRLDYNEAIRQYEQNFGYNAFDDTRQFDESARRYDAEFGQNQFVDARNFGETTRQFDTTFNEGQRQYDNNFGESVYQDRRNFGENQFQDRRNFAEDTFQDRRNFGEATRQYDTTEGRLNREYLGNLGVDLGQLNLQQQDFVRNVLSNPADALARLYFQSGSDSPVPQVTQADLINNLRGEFDRINQFVQEQVAARNVPDVNSTPGPQYPNEPAPIAQPTYTQGQQSQAPQYNIPQQPTLGPASNAQYQPNSQPYLAPTGPAAPNVAPVTQPNLTPTSAGPQSTSPLANQIKANLAPDFGSNVNIGAGISDSFLEEIMRADAAQRAAGAAQTTTQPIRLNAQPSIAPAQTGGSPTNGIAYSDGPWISGPKPVVQNPETSAIAYGYAGGGMTNARLLMVGDEPSGRPNDTEELISNPTGAPLGIVKNDDLPPRSPAGRRKVRLHVNGGKDTPRYAGGTFNDQSIYQGFDSGVYHGGQPTAQTTNNPYNAAIGNIYNTVDTTPVNQGELVDLSRQATAPRGNAVLEGNYTPQYRLPVNPSYQQLAGLSQAELENLRPRLATEFNTSLEDVIFNAQKRFLGQRSAPRARLVPV